MKTGNHLLSGEYTRFFDYAIAKGECVNAINLLDDSLPGLVRHYEFGLNSWPVFVSPARVADMAECGVQVPLLLPKLIQIAFQGDVARISDFYGVSHDQAGLALSLMGQADVEATLITRSDTVMTEKGLKTLEINFGAIGGWQIQFLDQQYRKQESLGHYIESLSRCESRDILREFYRHMVQACDRLEGREDDQMTWLMVFPEQFFAVGGDRTVTTMLERFAVEEGRTLRVIFARNLDDILIQNDTLSLHGVRIDMLLVGPRRVYVPEAMVGPYRAKRLVWLGNPVVKLFDDKRNLALLYLHRNDPGFTDAEAKLIERFLPWTTVARAGHVEYDGRCHDLRSLLVGKKDGFVIKHGRGCRGEDVIVGRFTEMQRWEEAIDTAFASEAYIAQEYCESIAFTAQGSEAGYCDVDFIWGIFGYGQTYGGAWIRMMDRAAEERDGIINSARGAQETIVYEVAS